MSNILNVVLAILIAITVVFYFYLKTKQFRSDLPIRKKWYSSRAGVALGGLLVIFGINQTILYHTTLTYIVCAVLVLFGLFTAFNYNKRVRHYGQFVEEEYRLNKK
ncbi:YtpI family protein [Viridibacillus sp. NPDC093762]|uniref:YtpI family protein n=1 Tax=Viridibacillus sp. NPDC093762 TaxID=3390720 RepID=UPI003CFD1B3E